MPRKVLILACILLSLHVAQTLLLGASPAGTLLANLLEISASLLAAAMCFVSARRAKGLARPFWTLLSCGMAVWAVADVGWMYYELVLREQPPPGSPVRFLFSTQAIFFALALFLDQDKDSSEFEPEFLLDFTQIAIVFFFIYLGLYYLPSSGLAPHSGTTRRLWVEFGEMGAILALACFQIVRARAQHMRKLYTGFAIYLLVFTVGMVLAEYREGHGALTGTFFDLCWILPFLWVALWAAKWQASPVSPIAGRLPAKTLVDAVFNNGLFVVAPLIVLVEVARLPSEWAILRFSLLAVSIVCFAVRVGLGALREARTAQTVQRQALAMDSAADGISIIGNKGEHLYANAAFARMMGYDSPDAMLGLHWQEIYDPSDIQLLRKSVRADLNAKGKWFGQITLRRRDGTLLPVEMSVASLPNGVTACIGHDITARKDAEKARLEVESRYRLLIEQVAAISYIAEPGIKGEWLYVSPQIEAITGYSPTEWLSDSRDWMRHVPQEDHVVIEAAEAASLRGQRFQAEYRLVRKDGTIVWVSDTAVVVPGSNSHPLMEGIIVDITERKQLENQLQQSRRMEAVGRLAGGIAHDFNNLLTIIRGYAELALQRPGIQPEIRADVMQVENAAERASVLVRQLLAFSRRQVLQPKVIDLNGVVVGLEKLLGRLIGENIQMATGCAPDVGNVKADPAQIEQVIMNLVVNARDAMPKGGRLTVETMNVELDSTYARDHMSVRPGPYVMLAVSDTGIGMSPETMAHIFEPFFTTKGSGQGTGLGLSTVYGIVKQSGGYIWVYSEPGKGTTFKVYLPRVEERVERKPAVVQALAAKRGSETILLVEDEEAVRELASIVLKARGYEILRAKSWREAEHFSANHPGEIHLLLTDIMMPGIGGRDLARQITARRPRTRVLYMSGYTDSVLTQGGVLEEDVSFLQKPFTPAALAQKVRNVLDAPVHAE
ncbi:MAG TPA: PAS domain S-box protein [Candidatus Methylomirabilis sp.]|nr:PAS domain S-box protein [Candidatus Methylomirabilis sp.]